MMSKKFLVVMVIVALVMALQVQDGDAAAPRNNRKENARGDGPKDPANARENAGKESNANSNAGAPWWMY